MKRYEYEKRCRWEEIGWVRFGNLATGLARILAEEGIDAVVGVARGGLFPATAIAAGLRLDLHPVRVTRREQDVVRHDHPVWKVDVPGEVSGHRVAVIDDVADTGETLAMVAARVRQLGARLVRTACLVAHSWAEPPPDHAALVSDALIIFPWDRRVLADGEWGLHPELAAARKRLEERAEG